ncbi:hypothetical protein VF21_03702 [Pseudogymnoascus sp. 05NY08]|nr:hypothetical protein VF21_03702 [Pseudogymnoascus sp. 05NY08]
MPDATIPVELVDKAVVRISPHQAAAAMATALPPVGHLRSAAEYNIQAGNEDAIIRDVSSRLVVDQYYISFSETEHDLIRMSISTPFQRPSIASLGTLNRLPYELLSYIVLSLDMQSVFTWRQVNTGLRQTIDSFSEYQDITTHALDALCALLRTRVLAPKVSLSDFHRELCSNTCFSCGEFGEVIFLPTFRRYCSVCITAAPEVQMGSLNAIQRRLCLGPEVVRQLSLFKTIRQLNSVTENSCLVRDTLVSIPQAVQVSTLPQADKYGTEMDISNKCYETSRRASCILPYYNKRAGKAEYGMSCSGCKHGHHMGHHTGRNGRRGVFSMLDEGVYDRIYGDERFIQHFKWCWQAQLMWELCERFNPVVAGTESAMKIRKEARPFWSDEGAETLLG